MAAHLEAKHRRELPCNIVAGEIRGSNETFPFTTWVSSQIRRGLSKRARLEEPRSGLWGGARTAEKPRVGMRVPRGVDGMR